MLNLNFTNNYDIVHLTPEIGKNMVGGICTFINAFYQNNKYNHGFVQIHGDSFNTIRSEWYERITENALVLGLDEIQVLQQLNCKHIVVHFYWFNDFLTPEFMQNKDITFVIHSIPTTEPLDPFNPFPSTDIAMRFENLCNIAKNIICVSEAEKTKLLNIFPNLEPNKVTFVYNGIQLEDKEHNLNYQNSRKVFGYIGRTEQRKGLFDTIKRLNKIDDVVLKVATGGHLNEIEMSKITTFLSATESYDRVDFLGWIEGKRKENFFKSIDALIIPSLYEPFGYTLLEAIQYGVPVICSNCGGLGEILGKEYKYQFNAYNEEEFYKRINEFINDDNETIQAQISILQERIKMFPIKAMVENYHFIINTF